MACRYEDILCANLHEKKNRPAYPHLCRCSLLCLPGTLPAMEQISLFAGGEHSIGIHRASKMERCVLKRHQPFPMQTSPSAAMRIKELCITCHHRRDGHQPQDPPLPQTER